MPKHNKKEDSLIFQLLHVRNLITRELKTYHDVHVAFDRRSVYVQHEDCKYHIKVGNAAEVSGDDSGGVPFALAIRGYDERDFHFLEPDDRRVFGRFVKCAQAAWDKTKHDDELAARQQQQEEHQGALVHRRRPANNSNAVHRRQPRVFGSRGRNLLAGAGGGSGGSSRFPVVGPGKVAAAPSYRQEIFSDDEDNVDASNNHENDDNEGAEFANPTSATAVSSDPLVGAHDDDDGSDPGGETMEVERKGQQNAADDDEEDVLEERLPTRTKRIGKRLVKRATKRLDDDSSDDEFLGRSASLTTPAAQRVVSPSTTKPAGESAVDAAAEDEVSIDKNQPTITSFFRGRTEGPGAAQPLKATSDPPVSKSTPSPGTTPSQLSASPVRLVKSSHSKIQFRTFLGNSPKRTDSLDARRQNLFGKARAAATDPPPPRSNPMDVLDRADGKAAAPQSPLSLTRTVKRPRLHTQPLGWSRRPPYLEGVPRRFPVTPTRADNNEDAPDGTADEDRPVSRYRGIQNLGNTCYCASSLQMLCSAFHFIGTLGTRGGSLTKSVARLSRELQRTVPRNAPVDPREVKDAMDARTDRFVGYEQRDAHEFMGELVDRIHEELEDEQKLLPADDQRKNERLPTDDFRITVHKVLKCESCGYERTMNEMYRYLSIDIVNGEVSATPADGGKPSVAAGLSHFFQPDLREVKCEKCSEGTTATESLSVFERPRYLLLHLKRFMFVKKAPVVRPSEENLPPNGVVPPAEFVFQKNKASVSIPESLTLDPFCVDAHDASSSPYKLKSIVHHIGQRPSSGHYVTHAIRPRIDDGTGTLGPNSKPDSEVQAASPASVAGPSQPSEANPDPVTSPPASEPTKAPVDPFQWVAFDDTFSAIADLEAVLNSPNRQSTAYMLLYALDDVVTS